MNLTWRYSLKGFSLPQGQLYTCIDLILMIDHLKRLRSKLFHTALQKIKSFFVTHNHRFEIQQTSLLRKHGDSQISRTRFKFLSCQSQNTSLFRLFSLKLTFKDPLPFRQSVTQLINKNLLRVFHGLSEVSVCQLEPVCWQHSASAAQNNRLVIGSSYSLRLTIVLFVYARSWRTLVVTP